jgi:hypothetical protein
LNKCLLASRPAFSLGVVPLVTVANLPCPISRRACCLKSYTELLSSKLSPADVRPGSSGARHEPAGRLYRWHGALPGTSTGLHCPPPPDAPRRCGPETARTWGWSERSSCGRLPSAHPQVVGAGWEVLAAPWRCPLPTVPLSWPKSCRCESC